MKWHRSHWGPLDYTTHIVTPLMLSMGDPRGTPESGNTETALSCFFFNIPDQQAIFLSIANDPFNQITWLHLFWCSIFFYWTLFYKTETYSQHEHKTTRWEPIGGAVASNLQETYRITKKRARFSKGSSYIGGGENFKKCRNIYVTFSFLAEGVLSRQLI